MTWLYVPATSCPSVQASGALSSESNSLSPIGERLAAASVTWRGKPQPPQAWSRRWKQGGFIRLLSGLTCSPSTLDRGVASFISSLRETPAKTTALPESAPEPVAIGSSPPKSAASQSSAGLILSSVRTCRGTRTDNSKPSFRHWSDWATALRQEYSRRSALVTPCAANDCSSWPTATAMNRPRTPETLQKCAEFRKRNANQNTVPLYLEEVALAVAQTWHTPRANDPEKRGSISGDPRNGIAGQAENWAAPATRDHKGSSEGSITRQDGKIRSDMLDYQAEQFFRLPSSPDQPIAGGAISSTNGPNSNQPSVKRKLNPIFVEALMRWPTGLSGFERQEMAWTRWWQHQLSCLSALVSQPTQIEPDLFGEAA